MNELSKGAKKNLNFEQFRTKGLSNLKGNIYDISVSGNKMYMFSTEAVNGQRL